MNTTSTTATITGLEENHMYHIFVVTRNEYGTSLPSSIIVINLVKSGIILLTYIIKCETNDGHLQTKANGLTGSLPRPIH